MKKLRYARRPDKSGSKNRDLLGRMTVEELAGLLVGKRRAAPMAETIRRHGRAGAPVRGGMVRLVNYAAWLLGQVEK